MEGKSLIIDDDIDDASILIDAFADHGITNLVHVQTVTDAFVFLRKNVNSLPALIISDNYLPKITGEEFLQEIKSIPEFSHIPVILLSGTGNQDGSERYRNLGALDYLTKPSSFQEYKTLSTYIHEKLL